MDDPSLHHCGLFAQKHAATDAGDEDGQEEDGSPDDGPEEDRSV